jgi:hypothetical protein
MMSPNDTGAFTWDGVAPWEASLAVERCLDVALALAGFEDRRP